MRTAIVLCAGKGIRLGHLTRDIPKPMVLVQDRPLLEYMLRHLAAGGFTRVIINLHYKSEVIVAYFGSGSRVGVQIEYVYEPMLLGTAGAVKNIAQQCVLPEDFLVVYGDVFTQEDFGKLYDWHVSNRQALATIVVHKRAYSNSIVEMNSKNEITSFIERPKDTVAAAWVNSGLYCFSKKILDYIPGGVSDFPKDVFGLLVSHSKLYGYPLTGYRCAIDSPERLIELEKQWFSNRDK